MNECAVTALKKYNNVKHLIKPFKPNQKKIKRKTQNKTDSLGPKKNLFLSYSSGLTYTSASQSLI